MAKSNLKILNLNFLTQYTNNTLDSKYSYTYYTHFFLYYSILFNHSSNSINYNVGSIFKCLDKSLQKYNMFFNFIALNEKKKKLSKLRFELDLNLFCLNNTIFIVHNVFTSQNLTKSINYSLLNKKNLHACILEKFIVTHNTQNAL